MRRILSDVAADLDMLRRSLYQKAAMGRLSEARLLKRLAALGIEP